MSDLFHLSIKHVADEKYSVTAKYGDQQHMEDLAFTPSDSYKLAKKRLLERRPGLGLLSLEDQQPVCITIGTELFQTFLTGRLLTLFKSYRADNDPPRLALHLTRLLYREPWELLRDPADALEGEFLALIGSIIRFDGDSGGSDPTTTFFPPAKSLRCLFISPRPTPTDEQEAVLPIEPDKGDKLVFDIISPPTYSDFLRITDDVNLRPDGFIFFGHGKVRDSIGHLVFVIMQGIPLFKRPVDDLRSGSAISGALATKKNLRFSCLMACETAWMSDDAMRFENTVAGSLLTSTKMGFVLGAQLKLDFYAAQTFLAETLGAIQNGISLDLAVKVGRKGTRALLPGSNATTRSPLDWWVPVLYAKSTVFDIVSNAKIELPELTRSI